MESAEAWSKAFQMNDKLLHLDISHNGFDAREITVMNEGLTTNHSILGIHFAGNEGTIDGLGYIHEFQHDQF